MESKKVSVLIAAAGSGSRMGADIPKQYIEIVGIPILVRTLSVFEGCSEIDEIIIISREEDTEYVTSLASSYNITKLKAVVAGGDTRQKSIINGLDAVDGDIVLIHDAARPFVTDDQIKNVIKAVIKNRAAALGIPVTDTLKLSKENVILSTIDRSGIYSIQTPQGFETELIKNAHDYALVNNISVTDDCSVCEAMGIDIEIVDGSPLNIKITTPDDLKLAEGILSEVKKMRIGMGYDVHRLVEGRKLILGGIEIPYELGLLGHSDADVLLHAIMDSMLGSIALGDIGRHFPDTDDQWKGADSKKLLEAVSKMLKDKGATISNIDATIIAQRPKLADYIPQMIKTVAEVLGISEDSVNIKATTTEKLGFCGRGEGIAAESVCCVEI